MYLPPVQKQLLQQLADGQFHSGSQLAILTGLSRSAVWKQLQGLDEYGIQLLALSGKGYRLSMPLQLLDAEQIQQHLLEPARQQLQLMLHDYLDSTNSQLMQLAQQQAVSGLTYLTEYQSAGKGRRGKHWLSPFAQNIYVSVLWRYVEGPAVLSGLSLAVGVAVIRALTQFGVNDIGLKWPNDVYHKQRKLGGILVEVSGESGGPCHTVVGLGLNLQLTHQQAAVIDQPWVDLQQILGEQAYQHRNRLIALLLNEMSAVLADFATRGCQRYLAQFRQYDCLQGLPIQLSIGEQQLQGVAAGIDDNGLLLIAHADGQTRAYASGEVSVKAL